MNTPAPKLPQIALKRGDHEYYAVDNLVLIRFAKQDEDAGPLQCAECSTPARAIHIAKCLNEYSADGSPPAAAPTGAAAIPQRAYLPWMQVALCKFVAFEDSWDDATKLKWFDDFTTLVHLLERAAASVSQAAQQWQPIETAPRDGTAIFVCSKADIGETPDGTLIPIRPRAYIAVWNPKGTSWVDEMGDPDGEICTLGVTGTWSSGGGWFQPNEVTHWMPLPAAPEAK